MESLQFQVIDILSDDINVDENDKKHKEFLDNLSVDPVIKVNDLIADKNIYSSRKKVKSHLSNSVVINN